MSERWNVQISLTVTHLDGIRPDLDEHYVEDLLLRTLREYYGNKAIPAENFDSFVAINFESQPFQEPMHIIEFDENGGWTLQHPMQERPDLIACPYNTARKVRDAERPVGRFYCKLETMQSHRGGTLSVVVPLGEANP